MSPALVCQQEPEASHHSTSYTILVWHPHSICARVPFWPQSLQLWSSLSPHVCRYDLTEGCHIWTAQRRKFRGAPVSTVLPIRPCVWAYPILPSDSYPHMSDFCPAPVSPVPFACVSSLLRVCRAEALSPDTGFASYVWQCKRTHRLLYRHVGCPLAPRSGCDTCLLYLVFVRVGYRLGFFRYRC